MYRCLDCGALFERPDVWYDDPSPAGVALTSGAYEYQQCPKCGSGNFNEAGECAICGDYIAEGVLCEGCRETLKVKLTDLAVDLGLTTSEMQEAIADVLDELED